MSKAFLIIWGGDSREKSMKQCLALAMSDSHVTHAKISRRDGAGSDMNKLLVIRLKTQSGSGQHIQQPHGFEALSLDVGELGSLCWFIHPPTGVMESLAMNYSHFHFLTLRPSLVDLQLGLLVKLL